MSSHPPGSDRAEISPPAGDTGPGRKRSSICPECDLVFALTRRNEERACSSLRKPAEDPAEWRATFDRVVSETRVGTVHMVADSQASFAGGSRSDVQ
jgi:hypothetical protein